MNHTQGGMSLYAQKKTPIIEVFKKYIQDGVTRPNLRHKAVGYPFQKIYGMNNLYPLKFGKT